ncbi:inner membrane-spanning protein YciB [Woodsholea maritima]|uniref:inner membrane-spanning protein YciB n=1 Tax=Woodsholea maritima TaxID=240237 RepID=UPI00036624E5|nr:inner membrane-spanning protein YciB [Woodsholea maritima]
MSEISPPPSTPSSTPTNQLAQGSKLLVDVGPAAIFMISYQIANRIAHDQAIFIATGVFMVATAAAVAWSILKDKRFPPMLAVTFVIVMVFGGLTIYLKDPIFIYIKPTIINLIFSYAILISMAFGFNVWKALFSGLMALPDNVWNLLAIRWAVFFQFLAILNEFLWRHITDTVVVQGARWFDWFAISEGFWVNFKLLGVMPLTFIFALINMPLILKQQSQGEAKSE